MSQTKTKQTTALIKRHFPGKELLDLLAGGHSVRSLAKIATERTGKPISLYYLHKALLSFGEEYREAQAAKAALFADKAAECADRVTEGQLDPASARAASEQYRWHAGRLDRQTYGDSVIVETKVDIGQQHLAALRAHMQVITARVLPEPALPAPSDEE